MYQYHFLIIFEMVCLWNCTLFLSTRDQVQSKKCIADLIFWAKIYIWLAVQQWTPTVRSYYCGYMLWVKGRLKSTINWHPFSHAKWPSLWSWRIDIMTHFSPRFLSSPSCATTVTEWLTLTEWLTTRDIAYFVLYILCTFILFIHTVI